MSPDRIELGTSIASELLSMFLASGHPALHHPVTKFALGQNLWRSAESVNSASTVQWIGEEVIKKVQALSCVIHINSQDMLFPKTQLRRNIAVGMMVELLPGAAGVIHQMGRSGAVVHFDDTSCVVLVNGSFQTIPQVAVWSDISIGNQIVLPLRRVLMVKLVFIATVAIDLANLVECHVNSLQEAKTWAIPSITWQDILQKALPIPATSAVETVQQKHASETYTGVSPLQTFLHMEGNNNSLPKGFWAFKAGQTFNQQWNAGKEENRCSEEDHEREFEQWRLALLRVEVQQNQATSEVGTQAAASKDTVFAPQKIQEFMFIHKTQVFRQGLDIEASTVNLDSVVLVKLLVSVPSFYEDTFRLAFDQGLDIVFLTTQIYFVFS
ncbi:hypothetical protein BDP27DRAFT_1362774 [Rhodocollybia butyracea]|uniref:Uncharacterized protein n=1 Tax=Rhodocollybia butyracea TaxID=206335 RepID=A0A9P5PVR8_9AGAR|nr:hypothetical protein BDP27DRAFT_1362774 [Rhodocollybia butyracea]